MITVDSREGAKTKILQYLPPDTLTHQLEVGDFIINGSEGDAVLEKKTPTDLILSARDRLWEQLKAMSNVENYQRYIILEGEYIFDTKIRRPVTVATYFKRNPGLELNYYTIQASIYAFNVRIIATKDNMGTAIFLKWLNDKLGIPKEKKDYPLRNGFKKDWDIKTKRLYLLEAFGMETAKALLKEFGNFPTLVATQEVEKIAEVKLGSGRKIGPAKAKEIYDIVVSLT